MPKMQDPKDRAEQVVAHSVASLDKITREQSSKRERPVCTATMPAGSYVPPPPYRGQVVRG